MVKKKLIKKKVVKKPAKEKVQKLPVPDPMVASEEPKSAADNYDDETMQTHSYDDNEDEGYF